MVMLIAALVITAWALQDKITKLALDKLSEYINAPFGMEDMTFSLTQQFPFATVKFNGLWMGASGERSTSAAIDTLVWLDEVFIAVESRPLLDNVFNIRKVKIVGGYVHYRVDEVGITCYDFLLKKDSSASDSSTSSLNLTIDDLDLEEVTLYYKDAQTNAEVTGFVSELESSVVVDSITTQAIFEGDFKLTDGKLDGTELHKMQEANLSFSGVYDTDTLSFDQLTVQTEGANLAASGSIILMREPLKTDLSLEATDLDLAVLRKYLPAEYAKRYRIEAITGNANLQGRIHGDFSDSEMPHYEGTVQLLNGGVQYASYPRVNKLSLTASFTNGADRTLKTTSIKVDKLRLASAGNTVSLQGSLDNFDELHYAFKTQLKGNLETYTAYVADSALQGMEGKVVLDLATSGVLPSSITNEFVDYLLSTSTLSMQFKEVNLDLDSTLSVRRASGQVHYANHELALDSFSIIVPQYKLYVKDNSLSVHVDGSVVHTDSTEIEVLFKELAIPGVSLNGSVWVKNLSHPSFELQDTLSVDLQAIREYIPDSLVTSVQGKVMATVQSSGRISLDSIAGQIADLIYDSSVFHIHLQDVLLEMPDTRYNVQELNGHFDFNPAFISVQNFSAVYAGIDFQSETTVIKNAYKTLLRDQPGKLEVDGIWNMGALDYDRLMSLMGSSTSSTSSPDAAPASEAIDNSQFDSWDQDYEVKGKVYVSSFKYKKALLDDVSAFINIQKSLYTVDQLKFEAFNGSMNSSIKVAIQENDHMEIDMKNQIDRMDIRQMLKELDNFSQSEITYQNINGILSTEAFFTKVITVGDSIVYPDLRISGDLTLEKGAVFNYAPVQALASAIPGVKSLDTLELKTVSSNLFIFQNAIFVPKTYVVSNAFDVSAFGMQSFGEDYEYHLEVRLGEILLGKSKKQLKKQEAMGDVLTEENKNSIFIKSFGRKEKNGTGLDNKKDRNNMEKKVRTKNAMLNLIFHPKLVNFETGVTNAFLKE